MLNQTARSNRRRCIVYAADGQWRAVSPRRASSQLPGLMNVERGTLMNEARVLTRARRRETPNDLGAMQALLFFDTSALNEFSPCDEKPWPDQ